MLEQFKKLGVVGVRIDHRLDNRANKCIERRSGVLDQRRREDTINLGNVPLMQRNEDGALVRKVLVDRSDTYPCNLRDAIGGQ